MKKSILATCMVFSFISCKKQIEQKNISSNEIIGTAYIKGNLTKAVISPDLPWEPGNMNWNSDGKIAAGGVNITIRVAKSGYKGLYPNSNIQGTDVYSGTTDANGNFNIAVKANGRSQGVEANVIIESFSGTVDTVFNGVTRIGRNANYMGFSRTLMAYAGQSTHFESNVSCGANYPTWSFCDGNIVYFGQNNGPLALNTGTALITGNAKMEFITSSITGTNSAVYSTSNVPVPVGTRVYYRFDSDPITYSTKIYQTTTDAAGGYSFNIATVEAQTPGFNQNGVVWVADFIASRDTIFRLNGNVVGSSTGKKGVWSNTPTVISENSLYNNEIRNAANFIFGLLNFTPN